ncbi:MAG: hypothetical protein ACREBR_03780, partial [bacterium]
DGDCVQVLWRLDGGISGSKSEKVDRGDDSSANDAEHWWNATISSPLNQRKRRIHKLTRKELSIIRQEVEDESDDEGDSNGKDEEWLNDLKPGLTAPVYTLRHEPYELGGFDEHSVSEVIFLTKKLLYDSCKGCHVEYNLGEVVHPLQLYIPSSIRIRATRVRWIGAKRSGSGYLIRKIILRVGLTIWEVVSSHRINGTGDTNMTNATQDDDDYGLNSTLLADEEYNCPFYSIGPVLPKSESRIDIGRHCQGKLCTSLRHIDASGSTTYLRQCKLWDIV